MLEKLTRLAFERWQLTFAITAVFAALSYRAFTLLQIEAFPDVTDSSVEVVTVFPGQSAEEVERRVTVEVERVLAGTPSMTNIRSVSVFGLSLVTLRFDDRTTNQMQRTLVTERLREASLPEGVEAVLGPQATPVGQIYRYTLAGPRSLRDLRSLQDWVVERRLRAVPGVADVVTFGGFERQYAIRVDPVRLASYGISVGEVYDALQRGNTNAGGGYVTIGAQDFVVRGVGSMRGPADIGATLVLERAGVPIRVRDVAEVVEGSVPRRGSVGRGKDDEVVEGIVLVRRGENPSDVLAALTERVEELNASILPKDVRIETFYDRRALVESTLDTVGHNLAHGALLVVIICWLFLRSLAGALIVGLVIPLTLLAAFLGLKCMGMPANLISLGAIDFGILVEGAAVVVEVALHALHRLRHCPEPPTAAQRRRALSDAVASVSRPISFASLVILVGLVPLFTLERVEGRIFAPMAYTYAFAIIGARLLTATFVPAAVAIGMPRRVAADEGGWLSALQRGLRGLLAWGSRRRAAAVICLLIATAPLAVYASRIGTEFLPALNEGGLYITAVFPSTVALDETRRHVPGLRARIMELPETLDVLSHIGRPEDAAQAEGPNNVEFFVALLPMQQWRKGLTLDDIIDELRATFAVSHPGVQFNFSQPITDRVYETISGIIGQVVVKVRGESLAEISGVAEQIEQRLRAVPGVADLSIYQAGDIPQLSIDLDRDRLAQRGLAVDDVQDAVDIALGGKVATHLWEGERKYGVSLRLPEHVRSNPGDLGRIAVGDPERRVTLSEVADIRWTRGRSNIWREDMSRFVAVKFNVRGRDLGSVVKDAQRATADLALPEGLSLRFGGEFENQQRAMGRLAVVVPAALCAILVILFINFKRWAPAWLVMSLLPFATVTALAALRFAGENFSVSAAVGCVTLLGQVTLGGVLVCSRINEVAARGERDASIRGACEALRPVLLALGLAGLGLVPAAISHGMGSESQRPFAITIIGGLLAAVPLVLVLLPLFYRPARDRAPAPVSSSDGVAGHVVASVLALLCLLPSGKAAASDVGDAVTGGQVLDRWLAEGEEVRAWQHSVGAARFDVVTARLLPNPELSLGSQFLLTGTPPDGRANVGVQLSAPLLVAGQRQARERAARSALSVAETELAARLWMRAAEIRRELLERAFLEAQARQIEQRLAELGELALIARSRAAGGFGTQYDLLRIESLTRSLRDELAATRMERDAAESRAVSLVAARSLKALPVTPEGFPAWGARLDEAAAVSEALERRPDLELARRSQAAYRAFADEQRKEALPVPSVWLGSYVTRNADSANLSAGVALPLPLFDRRQGQIGRARAQALASEHEVRALELRIAQEVRAAVQLQQRAQDALSSAPEQVGESLSILEKARRAYHLGQFTVVELLDAYEAVWSARERTLSLRRAAVQARTEWLRAAGHVGM